MFNQQALVVKTTASARRWAANVRANGGGFEANSLVIANNFVRVLSRKSYYAKIIYLLPMLGVGIGAARTPLIDALNAGGATNGNFVDADFSQSTGLQGNGSNKSFDTLIKPGQLGVSNNGGLGWWENNISFAGGGTEPIGAYSSDNSNRYSIDLRNFTAFFPWGSPGNNANNGGSTAVNSHYYGNRSSATSRIFYQNGSQVGTNSTNDATSGSNDRNILICASNDGPAEFWPGRCAVAYLTDGTLSASEAADFHGVLTNYLMIPTGKPQS